MEKRCWHEKWEQVKKDQKKKKIKIEEYNES